MKNIFNQVQMAFQKSNVFDLTHDVKMSMQMGKLTPILTLECVPGDKFNISAESLVRFAPLVSPVMHRMDVYMHYFFVPNRILWPNWEPFITGQTLTGPSTSAAPYIHTDSSDDVRSLANYLGIPASSGIHKVSALPFAAYQKIWMEFYRDQNLSTTDLFTTLQDGDNNGLATVLKPMRTRAWEHDYFTSALPFAQKGPAVDIPLGEVTLKDGWETNPQNPYFVQADGDADEGSISNFGPGVSDVDRLTVQPNTEPIAYDPNGSLEVQATTINDLRRAFRLQEWLEKNARGGTRYIENILAHFGVKSSDKRLDRPEYITGSKSPVNISEVLNTTGETLPQGNMAGHGVSYTAGNRGNYYCEEHGYIIGIMSVLPKTAYQQGLPRHYSKFDKLDYYWPSFAHIGEQEIKQKELYIDSVTPEATFGYIPRYAEYKYMPSRVAGQFQTTLDFWHLGRIFATEPQLNQEFIECNPSQRIFAVTDPEEDYLFVQVLNKIRAVRKMPFFGNPQF